MIPARYGSTRFPAKILASETGKPLVQHVVERVLRCAKVREVIVATDDGRIVEALRPFRTRVMMTSPSHQSGTDRIGKTHPEVFCPAWGGRNSMLAGTGGCGVAPHCGAPPPA